VLLNGRDLAHKASPPCRENQLTSGSDLVED
jgi:hypothetical protein